MDEKPEPNGLHPEEERTENTNSSINRIPNGAYPEENIDSPFSTRSSSDEEASTLCVNGGGEKGDVPKADEVTVDMKQASEEKDKKDSQPYEIITNGKVTVGDAVYTVRTEGVWTTVDRYGKNYRYSQGYFKRLYRSFSKLVSGFPLLVLFTKEVIALSPWRFGLYLLGSVVKGLVPTIQIWLTSKMIAAAQRAVDERKVSRAEVMLIALAQLSGQLFTRSLDELLRTNDGILDRRFDAMLKLRLMAARAKLDFLTLGRKRVSGYFHNAHNLIYQRSSYGVVSTFVNIFSTAVGFFSQAAMLRQIMNRQNYDLALISLLGSLIGASSFFKRSRSIRWYSNTDPNYREMETFFSMANSSSNRREVKVFDLGDYFLKRYAAANEALGQSVSIKMPGSSGLDAIDISRFVDTCSTSLLYYVFAVKASRAPIGDTIFSMGNLTLISDASSRMADRFGQLIADIEGIGLDQKSVKAYYKVLDTIKPLIQEPVQPKAYESMSSTFGKGMKIEFRDVTFKYPETKNQALNGVSFVIEPGEVVCICGYNGAGKSTLMNLLARLYQPNSGEVFINDINIKEYRSTELHQQISILFQHSGRFDTTIREFIGMGDARNVNDTEKIEKAIELAGAKEFISKLPFGLDSRLGPDEWEYQDPDQLLRDAILYPHETEDNDSDIEEAEEMDRKLFLEDDGGTGEAEVEISGCPPKRLNNVPVDPSGGEWQKLLIARSFMRDCDLKVYDEFSSALDPLAENEVFKGIYSTKGQHTILYITHRMNCAPMADRVIMLEKGKVVENGSHDELIKQNGKYAEMFNIQAEGYRTTKTEGDSELSTTSS